MDAGARQVGENADPGLAQAILDASADGILLLDGNGLVLTANTSAEHLLGRAEGTLVGAHLGVPGSRVEGAAGADMQVVRPGGEIRTVELRTATTTWEGRSVVVVCLRDVTERLETLKELRESRGLLAQIAESAQGVFFLSTVEGELLYVSPGLSWFGVDPSGRGDGSLDFSMVHPDDRAAVRELIADPERAPYEIEYRMVRPGGDVHWARQRGFPVTDDEGRTYRVSGWIEDVTDHRAGLERLEEARRVLAQTVSNLDEAVLIIDTSGEEGRGIADVNPAALRIFGYSRDEMIGRTTEFLHRDREAYLEFGTEAELHLGEEGVFRTSNRLRRKDGTLFETEQTVSLLDPVAGLAAGAVSVVRDVSEPKRAEEELRRSEERFRQIAEHIGDVFWISGPDRSGITYLSPAFSRIWGRDPAEVYENSDAWIDAILPSDRERVRRSLPGQASGGWEQEYRIVRPDGEVRWIWDRAFPVKGPSGDVERIIGVAEDVTDRKQAEERFGVLSQEITDVIFVVGPDGVIRSANPSAKSLGGFREKDLTAGDSLAWVYPDDRDAVRQVLDEIVARPGAVARVQHRIITADEEVRHMESVARNRLDHPAIAGIIFTSRDITERLRLEDQLRQSQKMEAVGRLAGGIAHDFNNLLTVIRSQTDLLLMDMDKASPFRDEVRGIQAAADRAARLTSQLLAFSRDQVLRPRVVDLNNVVRDMSGLLVRIIGEDVRISHQFVADLPPVRVDPAQLEQVVLNLAVNARDAMPQGGVLTFSTAFEQVDEEATRDSPGLLPGAYTVLRVADTGVGMAEAVRQRIFEPFFTTKDTGKGTGLGLAMAYGFVKQSGGAIHASSVPGEGSVFALRFPVAEGHPESENTPVTERFGDVQMVGTVLVVEDDPDVRRVTGRVLERAGINVELVGDAEAGLERLRSEPRVALLLTDLMLPGMSGRALVDVVREAQPDLRVIVMSGYAEDSPGQRGDLPDDVGFVQKPFSPDELLGAVRDALGEG